MLTMKRYYQNYWISGIQMRSLLSKQNILWWIYQYNSISLVVKPLLRISQYKIQGTVYFLLPLERKNMDKSLFLPHTIPIRRSSSFKPYNHFSRQDKYFWNSTSTSTNTGYLKNCGRETLSGNLRDGGSFNFEISGQISIQE